MKVTNPHGHAVSLPNIADVAPGEDVDVPDEVGASLLGQGWTAPAAESPKPTTRGRKADAPKE